MVEFVFISNLDNKPTVDYLDRNRGAIMYLIYVGLHKRTNKVYSERKNTGRAVCQYDLNDNHSYSWKCIKDTANHLNINNASISACYREIYINIGRFK